MSKKYFVELRSLKKFPHNERFTVSDEFFDDEKPDIEGGDLNVDVEVRRLGDGYSIDIRLDGTVRVVCDRCLGMLDMPVEAEMQLRAKDDDGLDYDDEDLVLLSSSDTGVDIEWNIYEMAELALPIQRVHTDGECDEQMEDVLENYTAREQLTETEDAVDPRWEGLKALLDKK